MFAASGFDGTVIVWDTAEWERKRELSIDDAVLSLAFSPDGAVLAAGTEAGEVSFIDTMAGEPIGGPVTGQRDWVNSVAFSPDGETLVAGSQDGSISLIRSSAWSDDVAALGETLCNVAGRGLTEGEWDALVPFRPYDPGCFRLEDNPSDELMKTEERPSIPEPARGHDLFVSYSRADRERVIALTQGLAERGKRAWVDLEDIPPSAEWMAEIRRRSRPPTATWSWSPRPSRAPRSAAEELEHAREAGKRIVPVLVRATESRVGPPDPGGAELDRCDRG